MRHLLYYLLISLLSISAISCREKGKPGPCDVDVHITIPEFATARFMSQTGDTLIAPMSIVSESLKFSRTDVENMPYIGLLVFENPADSMDIMEVPVAIENGNVTLEISDIIWLKGTPTNHRLQNFIVERSKLKQELQSKIESDIKPEEIREAFSQFYGQQIVSNSDNPLAEFIFHAYGDKLDAETYNKVKVLIENNK